MESFPPVSCSLSHTARGHWHYIFDLDGTLLSKENYPPAGYDSFPKEGASYTVPTPPWLWVFTSPIYSWLAAMLGMVTLFLKDKISRRTKENPTPA